MSAPYRVPGANVLTADGAVTWRSEAAMSPRIERHPGGPGYYYLY